MCHWRRPEYSRSCLEHLSRCQGIEDYTVVIVIDGEGNPEVPIICGKFRKHVRRLEIVKQAKHLGCNATTRTALEIGFDMADYVIHIEDDILVARDGLRFLEWAQQFGKDATLFTTGIWRHNDGWLPNQNRPKPTEHDRIAGSILGFYVWGWGTWKDRWLEMKAGWTNGDDSSDTSWDTVLTQRVRGGRKSLLPYIGRANNIGEHLGTHRGASLVAYWAGSPGFVAPKDFERIS